MDFSDFENSPTGENIAAIESIIQGHLDLPTPPNVVFRLLEVVRNDEHSFQEIGNIISKDPSLTARMMKIANSSLFGFGGKIKTIENALTVLGINVTRNIALSFMIMDSVAAPDSDLFDMDYFWKRAITAAVAAEMLAAHIRGAGADAFLSGLLKDIGVLVMYQRMEMEYKQILLLKAYAGSASYLIEKELLGFDHGQLTGLMLKQWGLPENIYRPIFHHHDEVRYDSSHGDQTAILQFADQLSSLYHGAADPSILEELHRILEHRYALDSQTIRQLVDSLAERTVEILSYFDIDPGEMKPLSRLFQEANYELGKRSLSYEQMVGELRQTQEESQQCINKLLDANKSLRKLAYRDELTGLYNQRFFLTEMDKELARAKRYGYSLSLVFFDIDFFKNINDTYGHLVGDAVLRHVSAKVASCVRSCDTVVRYGGDEFAIIMPETKQGDLAIFAERLRFEVEKMLVSMNDKTIAVTISIGGTSFDGRDESVTRYVLLNVADQAIYQSKKSGRNTVTIQSVA